MIVILPCLVHTYLVPDLHSLSACKGPMYMLTKTSLMQKHAEKLLPPFAALFQFLPDMLSDFFSAPMAASAIFQPLIDRNCVRLRCQPL